MVNLLITFLEKGKKKGNITYTFSKLTFTKLFYCSLSLSIVLLLRNIIILFYLQAGCSRLIRNFSDDIRDSQIYTELIAQVAPKDMDIDKAAMTKEVSGRTQRRGANIVFCRTGWREQRLCWRGQTR